MPLIFVLNDKYFVSTITLRSTLVAVGPKLLDYMWYSYMLLYTIGQRKLYLKYVV